MGRQELRPVRVWQKTKPSFSTEQTLCFSNGLLEHVLVVHGFATGTQKGTHNTFDCDTLVLYWKGEPCPPDQLPEPRDGRWKNMTGFDLPYKREAGIKKIHQTALRKCIEDILDDIDGYI